MVCPKCGAQNKDRAEQCAACGVFFIKWLIARHKRDAKKLKAKRPASPGWMLYAAVAAALLIGIGAGLKAGRGSALPPDKAATAAFKDLSEVPLDPILKDAAQRGRTYGVSIGERDLHGFVLQGIDAFSIANLRVEARLAGEGPEVRDIPLAEYKEFKRTPYRCVVDGKTGYYSFMGKELTAASECWALGVDGRLENKLMVVYYIWERLQWVESKRQWALFAPEQERRFYRAHIARHFGSEAELRDDAESKRMYSEAGNSRRLRRSALAAAFRTRSRRAGALFRLEHL